MMRGKATIVDDAFVLRTRLSLYFGDIAVVDLAKSGSSAWAVARSCYPFGIAGDWRGRDNHQALAEFVAAVNDQISLEHRQWLEATEATREAMAKLDEALAAMQPPGG
jgi:hypothetical protein